MNQRLAVTVLRWALFAVLVGTGVTVLAFVLVFAVALLFAVLYLVPNNEWNMSFSPIVWFGIAYVPLGIGLVIGLMFLDQRLERLQQKLSKHEVGE